ncbi:hypothetical protein ASZ90_009150 [hydrocarbon metagenome]|uniref:DUF6398 domain-containing protein n=1 Tax=hydrocarbon metagenome TaxID=938273 RepID=A0A0W8FJL7_9ZZZZ
MSGTCLLCRAPVTRRTVQRHAEGCLRSSGWPVGKKPSFLIRVQDRYNKSYWLVVLARHDARLSDLDCLIRDVWVECCGHLSAFTIGGETYTSGDDIGDDMAVPLDRLLLPGSSFDYEYDFGTTTELELKVIGAAPVAPPEGPLCLIVRNDPLPIACETCGNRADFRLLDYSKGASGSFFCRECITSADPDLESAEIIENSPRSGVCGYAEDPVAAIRWYPPGWSAEDIVPEDLQEMLGIASQSDLEDDLLPAEDQMSDAEVRSMMDAVDSDIGEEVARFIGEEQAAHGEIFASMAEETVLSFCTFLYGLYRRDIRKWDAPVVRRCLLEEMVQNPIFPDEWPKNAVPILCRFLAHMSAAGRLQNAAELIGALKGAEPVFRKAATSPEKYHDLSRRLLERARDEGVDVKDRNSMLDFILREVTAMAGMDPDAEEYLGELKEMVLGNAAVLDIEHLRAEMILLRCEEFCSRLEDDTILDWCAALVKDLTAHPAPPLSRGDGVLWSAAIVYAACRDAGLIRRARGGSPLAQEISTFFDVRLSSIRNKVSGLKQYLPDTPGEDD